MTAYSWSTLKPQDFANFVLKLSFKNISSPGNQNSGLRFHSIPFRILECSFSLRFRFLHDRVFVMTIHHVTADTPRLASLQLMQPSREWNAVRLRSLRAPASKGEVRDVSNIGNKNVYKIKAPFDRVTHFPNLHQISAAKWSVIDHWWYFIRHMYCVGCKTVINTHQTITNQNTCNYKRRFISKPNYQEDTHSDRWTTLKTINLFIFSIIDKPNAD